MVKYEIGEPIFVWRNLATEFDVESCFANTFSKSGKDFVEPCAVVVGKYEGAQGKLTRPASLLSGKSLNQGFNLPWKSDQPPRVAGIRNDGGSNHGSK